jgi:NAD(P)-dependent dehydrogenase (short-subunit alcohol dehydrogenase family)
MKESEDVALVAGAGGGIGSAVVEALLEDPGVAAVYAASRSEAPPAELAGRTRLHWQCCDNSPAAIKDVVDLATQGQRPLARVVICNGILHNGRCGPEKALGQIDPECLQEVFAANAVVPMLWLQGVARTLSRNKRCVIAVLSARVGSITDNRLGGWYSYRSSKAALNMLLRSAAVELARRAPQSKLVAFHPGTTDTALSRPFQSSVPEGKLFSPDFVSGRLLSIMREIRADGELAYLDWDGKSIDW